MKRSWWIQAVVFALMTATAVVVLLPSVMASDRLPALLRANARRMHPAVEVTGGLRFEYEVDSPEQDAERAERTMQRALEKVSALLDKGCDWGASVKRHRNRIVIELPGIGIGEAPRIRALIERL
jgi:hypothetical protein